MDVKQERPEASNSFFFDINFWMRVAMQDSGGCVKPPPWYVVALPIMKLYN